MHKTQQMHSSSACTMAAEGQSWYLAIRRQLINFKMPWKFTSLPNIPPTMLVLSCQRIMCFLIPTLQKSKCAQWRDKTCCSSKHTLLQMPVSQESVPSHRVLWPESMMDRLPSVQKVRSLFAAACQVWTTVPKRDAADESIQQNGNSMALPRLLSPIQLVCGTSHFVDIQYRDAPQGTLLMSTL